MEFAALVQQIIRDGDSVLVVGLGISGVETAAFFRRFGARTICIESLSEDEYLASGKCANRLSGLRAAGAELNFGIDATNVGGLCNGVRLCVLSPGISRAKPLVRVIEEQGIQIVTEFELGVSLYAQLCGAFTIVITGSNGKTTTVTLIDHLLRCAKQNSLLCGNVGTPVVSGLTPASGMSCESKPDLKLVVEASSYQLERCTVLKPNVAAILNISDNHLERHGDIENYLKAKSQAFALQDANDFALLNADDPRLKPLGSKLAAKVYYFGLLSPENTELPGVFFDPEGERLVLKLQPVVSEAQVSLAGLKLVGEHNLYNVACAVLTVLLSGVSVSYIEDALRSFEPLEHRIEPVPNKAQITIFNDSKSTTVASAVAAVKTVLMRHPEQRLRLLLGGEAKTGSWLPLMQTLTACRAKLAPVICFGKDGALLVEQCQQAGIICERAPTLRAATRAALQAANPNDVILLSPGCASYDEFSGFEERGRKFKEWVQEFS